MQILNLSLGRINCRIFVMNCTCMWKGKKPSLKSANKIRLEAENSTSFHRICYFPLLMFPVHCASSCLLVHKVKSASSIHSSEKNTPENMGGGGAVYCDATHWWAKMCERRGPSLCVHKLNRKQQNNEYFLKICLKDNEYEPIAFVSHHSQERTGRHAKLLAFAQI